MRRLRGTVRVSVILYYVPRYSRRYITLKGRDLTGPEGVYYNHVDGFPS
jgi:hypothetical protein